jgi:osmotically-inducible protein OsmY
MTMAWTMQQDRIMYRADKTAATDLPNDREVKSTVVHRLRENPYTADGNIKVQVSDGVVELGGTVTSIDAKAVATDDVLTVPGVLDVQNEIQVRRAA